EALGDADRARKEYEAALPLLRTEVDKKPGSADQRAVLARAYAGLGRREEALREARRAVEALPISKDAPWRTELEIDRAAVEARVGETDAALEHIRHLLSIPSELSPALLRIDPQWAPLRADPRFRKLAELGGDPAGAAERKSIAVLPFVNMSSNKENEYFSDGITEEL